MSHNPTRFAAQAVILLAALTHSATAQTGRPAAAPTPTVRLITPSVPAGPSAAGDWQVRPLLDGRFRPGEYTLLKVRPPASVGRLPFYRIAVRPAGPRDGAEFAARVESARGEAVDVIVPVILYGPAETLHLTASAERDQIVAEADVRPAVPLRELRAGERMLLIVSADPRPVSEALSAAGKGPPAGWAGTAAVSPAELPGNLAGLEVADRLVLDHAALANMGSGQRVAVEGWARRRAAALPEAERAAALLLYDPRNEGDRTLDQSKWTRLPGAPFWAFVGEPLPRTTGGDALPEPSAAGAAAAEMTVLTRPRPADGERRLVLACGLGLTAAAGVIGLFAGVGRAAFGVVALGVLAAAGVAASLWQAPTRQLARLDVLEAVEVFPPRTRTAADQPSTAPARRMLILSTAAVRTGDVMYSTAGPETLRPAAAEPARAAAMPVRIETLPDGRQEVRLRPVARLVGAPVSGEGGPPAGSAPEDLSDLTRVFPILAVWADGVVEERLPVSVAPTADGRAFELRLGAGWAGKLTGCAVVDVRDALFTPGSLAKTLMRPGSTLSAAEKGRLTFTEARAVPVGDLVKPGATVRVDIAGEGTVGFAEWTSPAPGDDETTLLRKAAVRALTADERGAFRPSAPYLIGWSDSPRPPTTRPSALLAPAELGRLVMIRLEVRPPPAR